MGLGDDSDPCTSLFLPGDILILGWGELFPFLLLRPTDGHYVFRGLALVHGLNLLPFHPEDRTDDRLADLAASAGIIQEREWLEIQ